MEKMQLFDIRTTNKGVYEVIRLEPVVLGSFAKQGHALLFIDSLKGRNQDASTGASKPSLDPLAFDPEPVPEMSPAPQGKPAGPVNVPAPSPKPAPAPKAVPGGMMPVDIVLDEDAWRMALDRLAAGEKIKDVAEEIGVTFGKLRSKWAGAIRAGTHQKPGADSPVSGGVGEVLKRGGPPKRSPEAFVRDVAKLMGEQPLDDCQQSPAGRSSQDDNRT